jgi:hypothetical protein
MEFQPTDEGGEVSSTTDDLAARFLQGIGLADCPLSVVESRLPSYGGGSSTAFRLAGETANGAEALAFLSTLTWPATRHVAFAGEGGTTVLLNNGRHGSDYADHVVRLPRHLGCRFARVVDQEQRVWRRGKLRVVLQYAARIFALHAADGSLVRSVACMNDGGRWTYESAGPPHLIEATFDEAGSKTSERFPSERLALLSEAFGLPLPRHEQFRRASRFLMFVQDSLSPVASCTLAEADDPAYGYYRRGMTYVPHMETHAASVIADFERCLEIDPGYESRVGEYLREARRRMEEPR